MSKASRSTSSSHEIETATQVIIREYRDGRISRSDSVAKIFSLVGPRTLLILKCAFSILAPQEQDDLRQEVMLRVFRSLDTYACSRGRFLDWMDEITRNVKIDFLNGQNRTEAIFCELNAEDSDWPINNYAAVNPDLNIKIDLTHVLQRLPEDDRLLLFNKFFDGYTDPELAEKYRLPESTIKFHLRRSIGKVRKMLGIDRRKVPPPTSLSGERSAFL